MSAYRRPYRCAEAIGSAGTQRVEGGIRDHTNANGRTHSRISRRRFLELAGIAGGTAALGSGSVDAASDALSAPEWRASPEAYFVGPADAKPSAPAREAMYFETDTGDRCYYDGSGWRRFGRSSAACRVVDVVEAGADPTGEEPVDAVLRENYTGSEVFYFPEGDLHRDPPVRGDGVRAGRVRGPAPCHATRGRRLRVESHADRGRRSLEPGGRGGRSKPHLDLSDAETDVGEVEAHFARRLAIDGVTVTDDTDAAATEYSMRFDRPRVTLRGSTLEDRGAGTGGVLITPRGWWSNPRPPTPPVPTTSPSTATTSWCGTRTRPPRVAATSAGGSPRGTGRESGRAESGGSDDPAS